MLGDFSTDENCAAFCDETSKIVIFDTWDSYLYELQQLKDSWQQKYNLDTQNGILYRVVWITNQTMTKTFDPSRLKLEVWENTTHNTINAMIENHVICEKRMQVAIEAYHGLQPTTLRVIADQFNVPKSTLADRLDGKKTRTQAYEGYRIPPNAEETPLYDRLYARYL